MIIDPSCHEVLPSLVQRRRAVRLRRLCVVLYLFRYVPQLRSTSVVWHKTHRRHGRLRANRTASARLRRVVHHFSIEAVHQKENGAMPLRPTYSLALLLVMGACMPLPCVSVCEVAPSAATGFVTDQDFSLGYTTVNVRAFEYCYSLIAISFPPTLTDFNENRRERA